MATELKTKPTNQDVTEYINQVEDLQKRADCFEILKMMQAESGEKPVMWGTSIIGFGLYSYKYASGQKGDWPRIGFSPRKDNITLYLLPGFVERTELLDKLGKFKNSKACLYIKKLSDIDQNILKELIKYTIREMKLRYP